MEKSKWFYPALIGGSIIGLMALIPYVSYGAFLWAVLGGMIAARMWIVHSFSPVTIGRGAKIGLLAGWIGGSIYLLVSTPLMANLIVDSLIASSSATPDVRAIFVSLHQKPLLKYTISFIVSFIIASFLLGFAVLGGMVGVAIFERRKETPSMTNEVATVERPDSISG